jgi:hypothetical protein
MIELANQIIEEYKAQGYVLTLRQLFYQFVSRGHFSNTKKDYDRLSRNIVNGRLAGLIDWLAIEDRTRWVRFNSHWDSPREILDACAEHFAVDMWENQAYRPEVWIEKDALIGMIEGICEELDVPYFPCRGFPSSSEVWRASQRFIKYNDQGQHPLILYLGDHDPSGLEIFASLKSNLDTFLPFEPDIRRVALTIDQVQQYSLLTSPVKIADKRSAGYIKQYGDNIWELDALEPSVIKGLIKDNVSPLINQGKWKKAIKRQEGDRAYLRNLVVNYGHSQGT